MDLVKTGRPTKYNQELGNTFCKLLSQGYSLRRACKELRINPQSVYNWFENYPIFLEQYARAKQESADAMAEEILFIADDSTGDYSEDEQNGNKGIRKLNNENVQRSRLRVDTRKWLMAKMKPKKYGDQLDITSKGDKIIIIPSDLIEKNNKIINADYTNTSTSDDSQGLAPL